MQVLLATENAGKLKEFRSLFAATQHSLVSLAEFSVQQADETGQTFVENALLKARNASAATGLPCLADDSGLSVQALDGRPGIYSARYAADDHNVKPTDAENIDKLLLELQAHQDRSAYFVCVLTMVKHPGDPEPLVATGRWHGEILKSPTGADGFGYDPVFFCPDTELSAAEMGSERKGAISHRARAVKQLRELLS